MEGIMPRGIFKRTKEHRVNLGKAQLGRKHSEETKEKMKKNHADFKGSGNPNYKNGKKMSRGYVYILKPEHPFATKRGCILEHRLVVEEQIGRYLLLAERTHHLNETKDDNQPENLMGFASESAHVRFHKNPNNVKPEEIIFDGRNLKRKEKQNGFTVN